MALYQRPPSALTLSAELVVEICRTYLEDIQRRMIDCRLKPFNCLESLRTIINVSQVCRRWRDVVTDCPELWRHFINPHHRNSQWTQLLLERSKQVGITYVYCSCHIIGEASELFKEVVHADRLVSYAVALRLDCRIWDDPRLPTCWPQLQFLCLTHVGDLVPGQVASGDSDSLDEDLLLSPRFPSCISTPKLERLHLHRCTFGDVSQITGLKSLKELCVTGVSVWTIIQWVEIIRQLPYLRHLELIQVISRTWDEGEPNQIFDMELEGFRLKDERSICASFLQHCSITTSSFFQLECLDDEVLSDADDETSSVYDETFSDTEMQALSTYDETLTEAQVQLSSIYHRITPIVHRLLATNSLFSNCALRITAERIQCLGLPENSPLDGSPWPDDEQYSGTYPPKGGWITIVLEGIDYPYLSRMFKQLFQPIFNRVASLTIVSDDDNVFFKEDIWLSDVQWQSSLRLRQLVGVPFVAWQKMHFNLMKRIGRYTNEASETTSSDLQAILPDEGSPEPAEEFITEPLPFDFDDISAIDTSVTHQWS